MVGTYVGRTPREFGPSMDTLVPSMPQIPAAHVTPSSRETPT